MRPICLAVVFALAAPLAGVAQAPSAAAAGVAAQDTTPAAVPKKKGGLFGKMKGLSKSKLVKTVAKAALCNAVPGGSLIAGAIDAKKAKSVKSAAGAAANLTRGGSGSCMPGLGLAGKAAGAANPAGVVVGVGVPGLPTSGAEASALSAAQMSAMPGAITPEQLKQMEAQYRRLGMSSPRTPAPARAAMDQPVLTAESGRLILRGLPWIPASAGIRPDAQASFRLAMADLASAIQRSGKHYKVEARVEGQGQKALDRSLSQQRTAAVVAGLIAQGVPAERLKAADGGADKDARIVLRESK